jgi:signal peptidase I
LAVSLHALSVCNVVVRAQASRGPRITGAVAAALVVLACYGALSRLVLNPLLETRRMIQSTAPLLPGDILLIRRYNSQFADPQPGDVVAYRVNWTMGQPGRVVQFFGERIDRVLAMPGDRVEFRSGQMIVNGAPSPHRPLADRLAIEHEPIEIPPETYLIIPSTDPAIGEVALERALAQLWLVHRSSLTGRVLARHYPWSRFERF